MMGYLSAGRRGRLAVAGAVVLLGAAPLAPALAAPNAAAVPTAAYEVVDLGTLPGGSLSAAEAVNDRGEVVGQSDGRAVLWRTGQVIDLGTPRGLGSFALDINEVGQVVGYRQVAGGFRAFSWQDGALTDLPPLPGDTDSLAQAVNDDGDVLGLSFAAGGRPVLWRGGRPVDLSVTTKLYRGEELDNVGRIAGEVSSPDGASTIPVLQSSAGATLLTERFGATSGINDQAEVTGFFFDGNRGSFTWSAGSLTEIPMLPGAQVMQAQAINHDGLVVGNSDAGSFRWDGKALATLPGLAGNPVAAQDVNDRGQIVGYGTAGHGAPNPHAVLLLPL
jgi:probable HAF family extracellular repeat protein